MAPHDHRIFRKGLLNVFSYLISPVCWPTPAQDAPDRVASTTLWALTVTSSGVWTDAGAVYNPSAVMLPTAGWMLQLTDVLDAPKT